VPPAVAGEWRIPTLPDGATATLVVTATLGTSSTVFEKNTAEVVAVTEVDPDSLPNNCLISPFACAEDDNFAAPAPLADLQVTQEVDDDNPDPQDVYGTKNNLVTFTIRVTNNGTYPANLVKIWDVLPSGLVYVSPVSFFSCSVPTVSVPTGMSYNNSGIWTVGTLPSGACLGINITAKSTVNGKFINTAKVWSVTERDPNPYNNFADVAIITHRAVIINEVAWAGTQASAGDQWIELYNPSVDMTITNWKLQINVGCSPASVTDSNVPGIVLSSASGKIVKSGYYLMERGHNATTTEIEDQVYPAIAQNLLPTPNLSTTKITLFLCDNLGNFIDTANYEGFNSGTNPWPQGGNNPPSVVYSPSMERQDTAPERDKSWITNVGYIKNGSDANNDLIYGTPKRSNSYPATPTKIPPTRTPAPPLDRPIINEFLARPGYDWNQDGRVDVFDEFIEIKNIGITTVSLSGWQIDDEEDAGSAAFPLPAITLKPGDRVVYYGLQTNILLSDGGDTVRLINPKGKIFDSYTYAIAKFEDKSTCRLPDGNGSWYEDCIPTPALTNTREGSIPAMGDETYQSPVCSLPDTLPVDFLFAECRGYGANIWRMFWDSGWLIIPDDGSKWISFVE
jgi:uncharacterized repeat protein (TIGR01451 family)